MKYANHKSVFAELWQMHNLCISNSTKYRTSPYRMPYLNPLIPAPTLRVEATTVMILFCH